jgi:hypothetical protein
MVKLGSIRASLALERDGVLAPLNLLVTEKFGKVIVLQIGV